MSPSIKLYEDIKQGLSGLGYVANLVHENYEFADILADEYSVSQVPLAAFAQEPPSYRNACFGVVFSNGLQGPPLVSKFRSLGAPQIFEIHENHFIRWKMTRYGTPLFLEHVPAKEVPELFDRHREDWSPIRILEAKSIGQDTAFQLDFYDRDLLPLLEHQAREKLDRLLQETLQLSVQEFRQHAVFSDEDYPPLFRLLFRLIAAKVLADRNHPGEWISDDPRHTISAIQDFYSNGTHLEAVLDHYPTQVVAWERIKEGFHFQNLSVESLAYVYENTLVASDTRKRFGIHSTPPAVAEYITRQLPFEDLAMDQRRIFEPFAGHAVFLVAAMQRLRELLPMEMTSLQRHEYFVSMLSGIEIDPFAREVARLSLMLADYPNPNGWRLYQADAMESIQFDRELSLARIVLCNPPFENFSSDERAKYDSLVSVRKPATILHNILQHPPDLLGFVLPRSFTTGVSYKSIRSVIGNSYSSIDLVALPDKVFRHSDAEAILLLASKGKGKVVSLSTGQVDKRDLQQFYASHKLSRRSWNKAKRSSFDFESNMWLPALEQVWKATDGLSNLADVAEVHRGIEFNIPINVNRNQLIAPIPGRGFREGVQKVREIGEPYLIRKTVYLNMSPELMRGLSYRRPWHETKLIVNASRITRGAWTISASIDYRGIVAYQNFHGIWPNPVVSVETLAAILNGPVANAFVATREGKRDVKKQTLLEIPFPDLLKTDDEAIASLVRKYVETREYWLAGIITDAQGYEICDRLQRMIDAEVLKAYDLPFRIERSLLDYFNGQSRPGPVMFKQFFPDWFRPHLPWYRYVSQGIDEASAASTLSRLPVINDPLISEAMQNL